MTVLQCASAANPASRRCVGPPATFPGGHADQEGTPADHVASCTVCLSTMLQCWRARCDEAALAVGTYLDTTVERQTKSLVAGLRASVREEARQDVLVAISRKMLLNESWSPERIVAHPDHPALVTLTIRNQYLTWYRRNVTRNLEDTTFTGDLGGTAPRGHRGLEDADDAWIGGDTEGRDLLLPQAHDPAEVVTHRLRNVVVSEQAKAQVAASLDLLRTLLHSRAADHRIALFAGWMKYFADSGGQGSIREYCRQRGINETTGWRHITQVEGELAKIVTDEVGTDGETRELTLLFLHRIAALAVPLPTRHATIGGNDE